MPKETKREFVKRTTSNTLSWLIDRSENCPPIVHTNLDTLKEMLIGYLRLDNSTLFRNNLNEQEYIRVINKVYGFIWALKSKI